MPVVPGRYRMREAATHIAVACGAPDLKNQTMDELSQSADDGTLPVFLNGQLKRYRYRRGAPGGLLIRESLEVYGDDLNEWLVVNEPHCEFRFPVAVDASRQHESPGERRARWLAMLEKEQDRNGRRGGLQRVFEAEKMNHPRLDRSYMGKEIEKARRERAEVGSVPRAREAHDPFGRAVIRHGADDRLVQ